MKFAIINDMHISKPDTGWENGVQRKLVGESDRLVQKLVQDMNTTEHPAFVVNLGDTIEDVGDKAGDTYQFKRALKMLNKLNMPVYHLIGNHDVKTNTKNEVAKLLGYKKLYFSFDNGGYHFIALSFERDVDEHSPTFRQTLITPDEISWLKKDLAKTTRPTMVFSHYGLADDDMIGNFWFEKIPDRAVISNRAEVRKILAESGKVIGVISAHQHWNRLFVHNEIPYITVTSLVENFNNDGIAAEAYTIVNLEPDKVIVHVRGNDPARYEHSLG